MFEAAIAFRDHGRLDDAIRELLKIIASFSNHPKISGVYTVLGGIYMDMKDYASSLLNLRKAAELNPKSELASMCLYISYVKLGEYEEAIGELKRYLDDHPAKLYKDTLKELLEDIEMGYATAYQDTIRYFVRKNGME